MNNISSILLIEQNIIIDGAFILFIAAFFLLNILPRQKLSFQLTSSGN